jgi:deoxyribose-phosphate aldolase
VKDDRSDIALHRLIQSRAKSLIEFLQIDDSALYSRLPHLKAEEPYQMEEHEKWARGVEIGRVLDHTQLKQDATKEDFDKLCDEAVEYGIGQVCVPGGRVEGVMARLKGLQLDRSTTTSVSTNTSTHEVKVASVMAFPHGNGHTKAKVKEAEFLLSLGTMELDMVMDVGKMKEKNYHDVQKDIRLVCQEATHRRHSNEQALAKKMQQQQQQPDSTQFPESSPVTTSHYHSSTTSSSQTHSQSHSPSPSSISPDSLPFPIVKVILETCLLSNDQVIDACMLAVLAGAHFVKTSTGFSTSGATASIVRLMKLTVGDAALVKASGGIRSLPDTMTMLENGASRIGTSSGVSIVQAYRSAKDTSSQATPPSGSLAQTSSY